MAGVLSSATFAKLLSVLLAAFALSCAMASTASAAGTAPIHCKGVTVSSGVLRVGGVLSDSESFKGALRVKATREGRKPYFLPSGDLVSSASIERRIPPGKVEIMNPSESLPFNAKKAKGRWRSVPVTVKDVRFAGEYTGGLELGSGGCKVEFVLSAVGGGELSLVGTGTKVVKLKLSRCRNLSCGPGDLGEDLNPSSSRANSVSVQIDNAAQGPAEITAAQVALNSEVGEEAVSEAAFSPFGETTIGPQQATTLPPIGIDRSEIEPGHYNGAIYLTLTGAEKRTVLPFELDVKDGPFWAIIVLFAAYVVHLCIAFVKYARSRNSAPQKIKKARKKAKVKLGSDAVLIEPQLDKAAAMAENGDLRGAESESARIDEEIDRVETARELEVAAMSGEDGLSEEMEQKVGTFQATVLKGENSKKPLEALERELKEQTEQKVVGSSPKKRSWVATAIIGFGVYVLPWLVRIVLVVAFLLAGLEKLYFSNATFGAQQVVDYAGLFLWGLSAAGLDIVVAKFMPDAAKA
jgi:membrane protein implicated in regulation of membrane protease activity